MRRPCSRCRRLCLICGFCTYAAPVLTSFWAPALGEGTYAVFRMAMTQDGELVAVKEAALVKRRRLRGARTAEPQQSAVWQSQQRQAVELDAVLHEAHLMQQVGSYLAPRAVLRSQDRAFMVIPLMAGPVSGLREALARDALGVVIKMDIAAQTARCLAACHREGVVHRDASPANILYDARGPGRAS